MKKSLFLKNMQIPEIVVLVIFILYLIFPVSTPGELSPYIESPLGVVLLLIMIVALFLYSHPIVAVLFMFVAYTLLRRSAVVQPKVAYVQETQSTKDKMKAAQDEWKRRHLLTTKFAMPTCVLVNPNHWKKKS